MDGFQVLGRTVYIARHGERLDHIGVSEWKEGNYPQLDRRDSPLSEVGVKQSQELAQRIKKANLRNPSIFTSPFYRTVETAYHIATELQVPLYCEWGFVENLGKGKFSSLPNVVPVEQLQEHFPCVDAKYESQWGLSSLRAGESDADIAERTKQTLHALLKKVDGDLVIVSHSSICRILTAEMVKLDPVSPHITPLKPTYCSLTSLRVLMDKGAGTSPTSPPPSPRRLRACEKCRSVRVRTVSSPCCAKELEEPVSARTRYLLEHHCDVSHLSLEFSPNNLRRSMRESLSRHNSMVARASGGCFSNDFLASLVEPQHA